MLGEEAKRRDLKVEYWGRHRQVGNGGTEAEV